MSKNVKFMMVLDPSVYKKLERIAENRGSTTVQMFIRTTVIPEWFSTEIEGKQE